MMGLMEFFKGMFKEQASSDNSTGIDEEESVDSQEGAAADNQVQDQVSENQDDISTGGDSTSGNTDSF